MPVISSYASGKYKVNAGIVQLAKSAAENARMIVKEFQGYTETEKLYGYKEMICYLTSYNDDVTEDDEYGDPWQLIYVFDGDDSTNVVCEGYSKAILYSHGCRITCQRLCTEGIYNRLYDHHTN